MIRHALAISKEETIMKNAENYTVENLLHDLMHLSHDDEEGAEELSYKADDILIDSRGMLVLENLKYLVEHHVHWDVGESDSFGVFSIILRWTDLCGHLHEMFVG